MSVQGSVSQLIMSPARLDLHPVKSIISLSVSSLLNIWASVTSPYMDIHLSFL